MYPPFSVPGVPESEVWQLFNVSNYEYYRQKVNDLREGKCPFCEIDPNINKVLLETRHWRVWMNKMAPRSGQECQLIIPSRRHIERISEMDLDDWIDLYHILGWTRRELGLGDAGVFLVRSGDPAMNAKSVPHLHWNFQKPTGKDRVEVTIAKSQADLEKKLPLLRSWERYRLLEEAGNRNPQEALDPEDWELIKDRMKPPETAK